LALLGSERPTNYYDPGTFWSGDESKLLDVAALPSEIRVDV